MNVERFEDLNIWQGARHLVVSIYDAFDKDSRGGQDFGFKNQITRAAVSTMNNIAEGFERNTDADFAHFLDIAKGSAGEVRSMLYAAEDLFYLDVSATTDLRKECEELGRGIAKLANYLRKC